MTRLSAAFGRLLDALAVVAALILLAMVVVVTADILLRKPCAAASSGRTRSPNMRSISSRC